MKKVLTALMLAAMLISAGCGNNAMDGAKKDAEEAAQKVEQTANEAKDAATAKADEVKKDAEAKVDEVKDAANQATEEASAKVDEAKDAAAQKADEMKIEAEAKVGEISEGAKAMRDSMDEISFNGIVPGFSIDEVKEAYGEPVETAGEVLTFMNGAIVNVDSNNNVKSIRLTTGEVETPEGVAVGMSEYVLNDAYGTADAVKKLADGAEYEYHRGKDKVAKLVFKTRDGFISEIESEFNK